MQKIALVTGANRGIGKAIANGLAKENIFIFWGVRNLSKSTDAFEQFLAKGGSGELIEMDMNDEKSLVNGMAKIEKKFNRLDILINNAGVYLDPVENNSFFSAERSTFDATFSTNLFGPIKLIQLAVPLMKKNNFGRIVNVSSGMGQLSEMEGFYPAYRISKTALNAVTKLVASELKDSGISINSMCPGWVHTDMGGKNAPRTPEEGAQTAIWLATCKQSNSGGFYRDQTLLPW